MSNQINKRICTVKRTLADIEKDSIWRSVCASLETNEFEGLPYCVLHMPTLNKDHSEFNRIIEDRLNSNFCDYSAIYFPTPLVRNKVNFKLPLNFIHATFLSYIDILGGHIPYVYFDYATFYDSVRFYSINFSGAATFSYSLFKNRASFTGSDFQVSNFDHATFEKNTEFNGWVKFHKDVDFSHAKFFGKTDFSTCNFLMSAKFNDVEFLTDDIVSFNNADFQKDIVFDNALINGYLNFKGSEHRRVFGENSSLSFQNVRVKKSNQISFHTVFLSPNWFINTDSREFVFTNISWNNFDNQFKSVIKESEVLKTRSRDNFNISNPNRLLQITYRHLADNAENNNRFEEASKFRRMAFETERLERKKKILSWWTEKHSCKEVIFNFGEWVKNIPFDLFYWGYRWSSGYGESRVWAIFILFSIIIISAILYSTSFCQFPVPNNPLKTRSLEFIEAIAYSLRVMVLQRPEPFPINTFGKALLAIESVIAPLQLALLALAIRRKFMR
jgi:uncharacterized protein YjbI with pentapeptide repeats